MRLYQPLRAPMALSSCGHPLTSVLEAEVPRALPWSSPCPALATMPVFPRGPWPLLRRTVCGVPRADSNICRKNVTDGKGRVC